MYGADVLRGDLAQASHGQAPTPVHADSRFSGHRRWGSGSDSGPTALMGRTLSSLGANLHLFTKSGFRYCDSILRLNKGGGGELEWG